MLGLGLGLGLGIAPGGDTMNLGNDVLLLSGHGAPVDGIAGTGAGQAGPGSQYTNVDADPALGNVAGIVYINQGTKASPAWKGVSNAP